MKKKNENLKNHLGISNFQTQIILVNEWFSLVWFGFSFINIIGTHTTTFATIHSCTINLLFFSFLS
jgi:hypothetical protein